MVCSLRFSPPLSWSPLDARFSQMLSTHDNNMLQTNLRQCSLSSLHQQELLSSLSVVQQRSHRQCANVKLKARNQVFLPRLTVPSRTRSPFVMIVRISTTTSPTASVPGV